MTAFDLIAVLVVAISVAFSIWRGLVREVLALLSWVLAFCLARLFAVVVAGWLPSSWSHQGLRIAVGFVAVMLVSVLAFSLVSMMIVHLVKVAGLTTSDRMLGAVFGLLRGLLIVVTMVLLGGHDLRAARALLAACAVFQAVGENGFMGKTMATRGYCPPGHLRMTYTFVCKLPAAGPV